MQQEKRELERIFQTEAYLLFSFRAYIEKVKGLIMNEQGRLQAALEKILIEETLVSTRLTTTVSHDKDMFCNIRKNAS